MFVRNDRIEPDTNTWHHCTANYRTGQHVTACGLELRDCLVVALGRTTYFKPITVVLAEKDPLARQYCHDCFGDRPWTARIQYP
jgi:hypothetical protein